MALPLAILRKLCFVYAQKIHFIFIIWLIIPSKDLLLQCNSDSVVIRNSDYRLSAEYVGR